MTSDNDRLNLLLDLRRYADAERAARDAIGRDPQWAAGYTHLARALIGLNQKDAALDAAREGARKAPQDAWAVGTLACALNWFGLSRQALEPAEQAVKLDPQYTWAYSMLANVLYNLDRFAETREKAVEGLRFDPLNEGLIRWKAWAEHKLNEPSEALRTAEAGLKHHPNSHLLLNLIGCVKWTQAERAWGRKRLRLHREADAKIRDSIRLDPTQPAYRDNLRGNAVSCRVHLLSGLLSFACLAFSSVPVMLFARVTLPNSGYAPVIVTVASLGALVVTALLATSARCALAAPLDRFGAPAAPLTPREYRLGQLELYGYGLVMLVPYGVLLGLLLA